MLSSPTLTIYSIEARIKNNTLPANYRIQTPCNLDITKVVSILSLFKDNQQMLEFIKILSDAIGICVFNDNKCYQMGSITRLIEAYANYDLFPPALTKEKQNAILEHFKKNVFIKQQIVYLLNNIGNLKHRQLLEHGFDKNVILDLASDYRHLSTLPRDTNRTLYHFLNPHPQLPSSRPLLDIYYLTARTAHVLGISGNIEFQAQDRKYNINTGAEFPETSLKILVEQLDAYRQAFPGNISDNIYNAFKFCHEQHEPSPRFYQPNAAHEFLNLYQKDQLIYLTCWWPDHCVGMAFFGNYLIFCNRGEGGDQQFGCKIYEIKNLHKINLALFYNLTHKFDNKQDFFILLNQIVDLNHPVLKFECKGQKHQTCSYVNAKALMPGMIVLDQAGPRASDSELLKIYHKELNQRKYKHLTTFIRDREIDELLKRMASASDLDLIQFFAALVRSIITIHHGKDKGSIKDKQEIERAVKLFTHLPQKIKEIAEKDPKFMQLMTQVNTKYSALQKQNLYLNNYKKRNHTKKDTQQLTWRAKKIGI